MRTASERSTRYLTRPELIRLADHFAQGLPELSVFLDGEHPAAEGRCFEIYLSDEEADLVDDACDDLGLGY